MQLLEPILYPTILRPPQIPHDTVQRGSDWFSAQGAWGVQGLEAKTSAF